MRTVINLSFFKHFRGGVKGLFWFFTTEFVPRIPSQHIRNRFMRMCGAKLSKNVKFYSGFSVRNPKGLVIEDGVSIGPGVLLDARKGLTIRKNATVAYQAIIWSLNHDYNDVHFCGKGGHTEIGAFAWICSRSIIMPGISIGEGAVVAAGAIVTKDVAPYSVVAGIPAKVIGHREEHRYEYGYKAKDDYSHFV